MLICSSCRRSLTSGKRNLQTILIRNAATAPTSQTSSQPTPSIALLENTPSISSATTSISQPLSTPQMPSISSAKSSASQEIRKVKSSQIRSSIPGGQELRGIAYLKNKPHVMALEDDEYPKWLWDLLSHEKTAVGESKVDLATLTKKQRMKYDRKQEKLLKMLPTRIPVHEQSKDLTDPNDNAITSLERRQEIIKSSRIARRKEIRESNFLKGI